MARWTVAAGRWYGDVARRIDGGQSLFLLLVRLYWGWQLVGAGWGKLTNVTATAMFFDQLGIPLPTVGAVLSGGGEFFGGLLLLVGLLARAAALVVLANMLVALVTAHTGDARAVLAEPARLITSPPFTHLMASLIVLLFGPGWIALDTLLRHRLSKHRAAGAPETAAPGEHPVTRRELAQLTIAAVGGLVVGAWMRGLPAGADRSSGNGTGSGRDGKSGAAPLDLSAEDKQALAGVDSAAPAGLQPSLLLEEPHTCCGLNTCKGKGKGGANACLGQGSCATANAHVCQGQNDCKGQGGCGEFPGQNSCQGQGACAVPLTRETWPKARKRFEELATKVGAQVGQPLKDCPRG